MAQPVLRIEDLKVSFETVDGMVKAVDGVSYEVYPGETLGVVGESGSGKSVTVLGVMGLLPKPAGRIEGGEVWLDGQNILELPEKSMQEIRGNRMAMVFQDPMTSLNPVFTVGEQIAEALQVHDKDMSDDAARQRTVELLNAVGVAEPETRFDQYPHEYSGGMRQRAMVAMAIANDPALIIADEPTTALDVTIQAQVIEVLKEIQDRTSAGLILITHDLGLVAELADRVVVMYGGKVVETGTVDEIFHEPRHPYTLGLMMSLPRLHQELKRLRPIPGQPPSLINLPSGCAFHPRCAMSAGRGMCQNEVPSLFAVNEEGHASACWYHNEVAHELEVEAEMIGVEFSEGRLSDL
ncbi:MAG: ABC transporter ATP-binding protein [Actinomycetota bacterium]|nr:ABC transporter ATP-binding protein [Actinomycetota bacterium]